MKESEKSLLDLLGKWLSEPDASELRNAVFKLVDGMQSIAQRASMGSYESFTLPTHLGPVSLLREDVMAMFCDAERYRKIRPYFGQIILESHPAWSQGGVMYLRSIEYDRARRQTTDPNSVDQCIDRMPFYGERPRLSPYAPPYVQPYQGATPYERPARYELTHAWVDEATNITPDMLNRVPTRPRAFPQIPYPPEESTPRSGWLDGNWTASAED